MLKVTQPVKGKARASTQSSSSTQCPRSLHSQYTHLEALVAMKGPKFMFWGRELSETCVPSRVQEIGEESL